MKQAKRRLSLTIAKLISSSRSARRAVKKASASASALRRRMRRRQARQLIVGRELDGMLASFNRERDSVDAMLLPPVGVEVGIS
jgi:hypothetical protein